MHQGTQKVVRSHSWEAESKSGIEVWWPPKRNEKDPLNALLVRAARALKVEDERIRQALASSTVQEAYEQCGHGLSYWVFEHNLIFPIFLDWAKTHVVRWDEPALDDLEKVSGERTRAAAMDRSSAPDDGQQQETVTRRLVDLQLLLEKDPQAPTEKSIVRLEAKWWVLDASKKNIDADVNKLRAMQRDGDRAARGDRAVLLAFWYGVNGEFGKNMDAARPKDTKPLMAAVFDSTVYPWWLEEKDRTLTDGYFALVAYELTTMA